jgi:hypothetical protein
MASKFGIRQAAEVTLRTLSTKKPFLHMGDCLTDERAVTGETSYARGKNNAKKISFDGTRDGTLTITTQLITQEIMAMLAGSTVVTGAENQFKRVIVTASGTSSLTVSGTPVSTATTFVFPLASDGVDSASISVSAVSANTVTCTVVSGTQYVVYYAIAGSANNKTVTLNTNNFPSACNILADSVVTQIDDNDTETIVATQVEYFKAKAQPNYTISRSETGEPTTLSIVFDLFSDADGDMSRETTFN